MILDELCPPAILYVAFSLTHIVIDLFKNLYNTAFLKFIVMIIFTLLLNILCQQGLDIVSWFIVFVPFIMMTVITSVLLFMFGLSPSKGNLKYNVQYPNRGKHNRGKHNRGKHNRGKNRLSKSERRRMRRRDQRRNSQESEPSAHQNAGHHKHSQHPDVYEDKNKPSYKKYHKQHGKYYNGMQYDEKIVNIKMNALNGSGTPVININRANIDRNIIDRDIIDRGIAVRITPSVKQNNVIHMRIVIMEWDTVIIVEMVSVVVDQREVMLDAHK